MMMIMKTFAPLTLLIAAVTASSQVNYPLVRRSDTLRALEEEEIDEMDISFEGSVADIQELAMQKAINSAAISPIGAFSCPDADIQRLEPLTWVYSVEYEPGSDPQAIISELELALEGTLAPRILACQNEDVADRAIVAVDSSPDDLPDPDEECDAYDEDDECAIYQGRMRIFLESATGAAAVNLAREEIRELLESDAFIESIGEGLVNATYLGPEIGPTLPAAGAPDRTVAGNSGIGGVPIALVAIGSAAVIVLVGSVLYVRRNSNRASSNGTRENNVEDDTLLGGTTCAPASPFTEMLPSAYRYTEDMTVLSVNPPSIQESGSGLSAVAEMSSGEEQSTVADEQSTMQGSIVVSESGYTAEGAEDSISFDMPKSLYLRAPDSPLLLGAKKRLNNSVTQNAQVTNDSLSEMSNSEDESVNTNLLSITQDNLSDQSMSQDSSNGASQQQQPDLLMDTLASGILDESAQTDDEALLFL